MEGLRKLTQLYSDTKRSCDVVAKDQDVVELDDRFTNTATTGGAPELVKLHLEFRKQRERLSAWGVEWADEGNAAEEGDIDEAVARAGLTDAVGDVLQRIQETLEEAEKMRYPSSMTTKAMKSYETEKVSAHSKWTRATGGGGGDEVRRWTAEERLRYEQLAKELTSSLDLLEDLSRTRKEIRQGTYPSSGKSSTSSSFSKEKERIAGPPPTRTVFLSSAYSESEETLVTPMATRTSTSRTMVSMELPARLDPSLLELPEEEPPPYDRIGATQSSRMIAYLKQPRLPSSTSEDTSEVVKIPVLIEFAPFDPAYRATGVPPPSERLDRLLAYHARSSSPYEVMSGGGTLSCLGFFEDPKDSRYGVVYELPKSALGSWSPSPEEAKNVEPMTFLKVLQSSSGTLPKDKRGLAYSPPLEDRFRMAFNLLQTFHRMHTEDRFAHKDVSSGSIIFFHKATSSSTEEKSSNPIDYDLRTPYITSFDLFTEYSLEPPSDTTLARNLYRHRDDPRVSNNHCSICRNKPCDCTKCGSNICSCNECRAHACKCAPYRFDLHSMALILIEIGLWMPITDFYKARYTFDDFMQRMDHHCVTRLGSKCGTTYMKVVQDMLQQANSNVTDEELRLHYLRWLTGLHRCCMIDEAEDYWATPFGVPPTSVTRSTSPSAMSHQSVSLKSQSSWSPKSASASNITPGSTGKKLAAIAAKQAAAVAAARPTPLPHINEDDEENGDAEPTQEVVAGPRYQQAACVIQRAWRNRSSRTSLDEYRERVSNIQAQWLKRTSSSSSRSTMTLTPSQAVESQSQISRSMEQITTTTTTTTTKTTENTSTVEAPSVRQKLRIHNIKIPPAVADCWTYDLQPRLERIVGRALKHSDESASIELAMVGETVEQARPTIFVTCSSASRVKGCLKRKLSFDNGMFDVKVRRGKIRRSKAAAGPKRTMAPRAVATHGQGQMVLNPFHQQRPVCGASIGAFVGDKHLPPVSFGGVVDVDGELFGMTVHHLLDDPSDDEDYDDSELPGDSAMLSSGRRTQQNDIDRHLMSGIGGNPMLQSFPTDASLMFPLEISDEEISDAEDEPGFASDVPSLSDEEDEEDEEEPSDIESDEALGHSVSESNYMTDSRCTQGDIPGISPGNTHAILVTQPALDDVDDTFFPCPEDRDEDHLDSHSLGYVYASSGIRRWNRKGVLHEVDWALLKLDEDRLQPCNLVQGGKRYYEKAEQPTRLAGHLREPINRANGYRESEDEYPTQVAKCEDLANLDVHCFGRTSGLQGGTIGGVMSSVRIYKRNSWSRSWSVRGNFGVGGDSGAWIIDNEKGRVCGHVLAWCERLKMAYICPADVLLDDMKRTLGASKICLPGTLEDQIPKMLPSPSSTSRNATELPDLARLGIADSSTTTRGGAERGTSASTRGGKNRMFRSSLNSTEGVSPRMEVQRLFGGEIAR